MICLGTQGLLPSSVSFSYRVTCEHTCFNIILPSCDPEPVLINVIVRKAVGLLSVHSLLPAESQRAALRPWVSVMGGRTIILDGGSGRCRWSGSGSGRCRWSVAQQEPVLLTLTALCSFFISNAQCALLASLLISQKRLYYRPDWS